jgi:quercetin dioxygenase-like cupin family protein
MRTSKSYWLTAVVGCTLAGVLTSTAEQAPPKESKGQRAKDLCGIDLTAEIDAGVGRRLRMRAVTLDPGGIVAVHGHQDRPTVFVVTKGTLLSHLAGQPDQTLHPGECLAEGKAVLSHWMENKEPEPVEYIAVDIIKQ